MRKLIVLCCLSAFVSLALLVPAGSAQAAWRSDPFCVGSGSGQTLASGTNCTSWPLNVGEIRVSFEIVTPGTGALCVGLTQYGGSGHGNPVPGAPGYRCSTVTGLSVGQSGLLLWYFPPYSTPPHTYRYGQARIVNYSGARIRIIGGGFTYVVHWL